MSMFEISFFWKRNKVLLLLLASNGLKKCCSVCNLMYNYVSAYGLATHILITKRHWSVRLSVYLSVGLSVCLPICLTVCLCVCLFCPSVNCRTSAQDKTRQKLYSYHPQKKYMKKKTTVLLMKGTSHLENSLKAGLASDFSSPEGTIPNDTQRVSRALPFLTIPIFMKLLLLLSFRKKWKNVFTWWRYSLYKNETRP